ncbi:unnamed protein product [Adineta steineri]|uniref:Protein kinase domain-containing protein n=2 Tax=Adineta steineri TaxID=433720 RepID=A0A814UPA1_9BILA|nr:unnamed protein product [Adineta steineri]CAF1176690.1 unnamed protein product [Adineta steineri]CAF1529617.1 unnamed protein product [Adineta steineri]
MGLGTSRNNNDGPVFEVHGRLYRILDTIGQGSEATVYKCEDQSAMQYAVKVFYFSRYPPHDLKRRIGNFNKEGRMLRYMSGRSRHFISLIDFEYKPQENVGYMIMELGDGSLREQLVGVPLPDQLRRMYWKQIVTILRDLQNARVVHADIKPDNLILVNGILKVTDLGLALPLGSARNTIRRAAVRGTLDYMAPEVFSHQTGFKSDVWSAGIILYEMTYGRPPFFAIMDRDQKIAAISSMAPISFPPQIMSQTSSFPFFGNTNQFQSNNKSNKFNLKTILDFSTLQPRVQNHLKNVYTCLLGATLCATLGICLSMNGWLNYPRLAVFASIITSVWLFTLDFNARTQMQCFGLMSATALFTGIYLSPLINVAINVDPQIVMTAFLMTTIIFVCFTLSALLTKKRTYLYLGGLLATGSSIMLLLSLMNLFGRSQLIFNINLYFGLAIACGYVLYDTQLIIERANNGDMHYVKHALLLFTDLVDIFVRILIILIKNSTNKEKKNKNR